MKWRVGSVAFLMTLSWVAVAAEGPLPVSPGGQAGMAVVSGRCPTFHWTAVEGAESVDLVVYRVPKEEADGGPDAVLSVTLPGSAHGWTPSLDECLESGGRYAWSVRATDEAGGSEWSEASLFEVSAAPSVTEVEEAMAVLRRYGETGEEVTGTAVSAETAGTSASSESRTDRPRNEQRKRRESQAERRRRPEPLRSGSVGAGPTPATVTPLDSYDLSISGDFDLGGNVFKEGKPFLHNDGGYGAGNTALGLNALINATPGTPESQSHS